MALPSFVTIVEVGPRDGLQNEKTHLPTETKLEFIERLSKTGLKRIEAAAFVSSKKIPQAHDAALILSNLHKHNNVSYPVLVPNVHGYDEAIANGATEIELFISATETFSMKNIHCNIKTSLERCEKIAEKALKDNILIRGYVSCSLGCPFEGDVAPEKVASLTYTLKQMGCYEISLGDTIGVGTPEQTRHVFMEVAEKVSISHLAAHFHDTYGQAIANLYAVLTLGVSVIDSSIAGLGGCPYAQGATGNVATEDVIYLLNGLGIQNGIDLNEIVDIGMWISEILNRKNQSKAANALFCRKNA